ncbi:hypothetical protein FOQG_17295 [Fusarium oxysporum f. sp. raphani 54005]|uniref:Uncharacterized protein n=2 Tax=Fusarium oxysporum TaxID=5507 RepID=X0BGM8_FUSOX|nr:hypothetical protein FOQG_17295 [Fusarium oxysporum f. sp. raphani 54005]EXL66946.1 hypothetical protein FOPG_16904 [Fusarium oxysporum f. sp. conglutinans race 2 54008]
MYWMSGPSFRTCSLGISQTETASFSINYCRSISVKNGPNEMWRQLRQRGGRIWLTGYCCLKAGVSRAPIRTVVDLRPISGCSKVWRYLYGRQR